MDSACNCAESAQIIIFALFSEKLGHQEKLSATAGHGGRHKSNV